MQAPLRAALLRAALLRSAHASSLTSASSQLGAAPSLATTQLNRAAQQGFANLSFQEKKRRALAASGQLDQPQQGGLQPQTTAENAPTVQPSETRASALQVHRALNHPALVVTRPIEWGTVIFGYEQANRYQVFDQDGQPVAQIAEDYQGLGNEIGRQVLRTRRSFRSTVFSADGTQVIFRLRRPAYLINSTMYIEDGEGTELGEVRQRWHPFKRNYDIYINKQQFASISGTFLAWEFELKNAEGGTLALIDRNFQGFGRELFTDAGKYAIHFGSSAPQGSAGHEAIPGSPASPQPALQSSPSEQRQGIEASSSTQHPPQQAQMYETSSVYQQQQQQEASSSGYPITPMAQARTDVSTIPTATGNELVVARSLHLEERMAVLAAAISIDYDYFSHHSHSSGWFGMWPMMMPYPGGGAPTEAGHETGDTGGAGPVGGAGGVGAAGAGNEAASGPAAGAGPDTKSSLESELGSDDAFPSGGFDKGGDGEMQWDLPQSEGGGEGGGGSILGTLWDLLGGGD